MERYNSDVRNRGFNQTLNGSNLTPTHITVNVPDGNDENGFDLNEQSNYTASVSEFVRGLYIARSFLVIGESATVGSAREPGHRDNPIVIEDDEEDEEDQHDGIFYEGEMPYEALLSLQEHIGGVGTGLKKNIISQLLKQSNYQSTKMKNCSDSCCVCLGTYDDKEELGKIDCGHEFHYQCMKKWLKIKNSCPLCRRIALNP